MASPHVAHITVDDAVAGILPDSIACIRAMDSNFDWHSQTEASDLSTAANSPTFTFEPHAIDEIPSHFSPASEDASVGSPNQSAQG
eukprot:3149661-Rhodomonas_salina.1